jgi:hypothetical protein
VHRAIGVEVVAEHEPRPNRGRPFDDGVHERRMQIRPPRVRRVDTVVDDRCALACPPRVGLESDVGGDHLNAFRKVGSSVADRDSHPVTSRNQMPGHGEAKRTRS